MLETLAGMAHLFGYFAVIIVSGSILVWIHDSWNPEE